MKRKKENQERETDRREPDEPKNVERPTYGERKTSYSESSFVGLDEMIARSKPRGMSSTTAIFLAILMAIALLAIVTIYKAGPELERVLHYFFTGEVE